MKNQGKFYLGVPAWLKAEKDDDVYAAIMTLLTEWETEKPKSVSGLATEFKEVFKLSDEQTQKAIQLLTDNGILKAE